MSHREASQVGLEGGLGYLQMCNRFPLGPIWLEPRCASSGPDAGHGIGLEVNIAGTVLRVMRDAESSTTLRVQRHVALHLPLDSFFFGWPSNFQNFGEGFIVVCQLGRLPPAWVEERSSCGHVRLGWRLAMDIYASQMVFRAAGIAPAWEM